MEHYTRRALGRIDEAVLQILRVGVYQLLHLDRVPAAAAVNDAVALTRRVHKSSAAGFVNAVLRQIARNRHRLPLPPPGQPVQYLAHTLSHPQWLAARWLARYGFEDAASWERFNNTAAPLTLRANRLKIDPPALALALAGHGVATEPCRFAADGLLVVSGNPLRTPLEGQGLFFVQDEASQLVALLGSPRAGELVLDACASPGGKTTAMAAMTGDRARIVAADVRPARMRLLSQTIAASGARGVRLVQADLARGLPFGADFDFVLVDAPCSGLGTIRRDPDIKWRRTEADVPRLADAQVAMLANAAAAVRPGGRLLYATCSSEPEENEEVVDRFLDGAPSFALADLRSAAAPALHPAGAALFDARGMFRTSPAAHRLEAFFGALLQRSAPKR